MSLSKEQEAEIRAKVEAEAKEIYPEPPRKDFMADRNLLLMLREAFVAAAYPLELKIAELEEEVRRLTNLLPEVWKHGSTTQGQYANRILGDLWTVSECDKIYSETRDQYLSSITKQQ